MQKIGGLICCCLFCWSMLAQQQCFELDTLSNNAIQLEAINFRYGHSYQFTTNITNDSLFLVMPKGIPKGYYEAYYHQDTNCLAMVYYNNGHRSYGQQFYANGAMKGDTEYNAQGQLHGLQVLYDRKGEELWHAEYVWDILEPQYDLKELMANNLTQQLILNPIAFGWYTFTPTPSRARRDRIHLKKEGTFIYQYSTYDCHFCFSSTGTWSLEGEYLRLALEDKTIWRTPYRKFALTANPQRTRLELLEVKDWGVEWYNSEYQKVNKKPK